MEKLCPLWIQEPFADALFEKIALLGFNAVVINEMRETELLTISENRELNPDFLLVHAKFYQNQCRKNTLEDLMRQEIAELIKEKRKIFYLLPEVEETFPWLFQVERELPHEIRMVGGKMQLLKHGKVLPYPETFTPTGQFFSVVQAFPEENELLFASLFVTGGKGSLSDWIQLYRPEWERFTPLFPRLQRFMVDSQRKNVDDRLKKLLDVEADFLTHHFNGEINLSHLASPKETTGKFILNSLK